MTKGTDVETGLNSGLNLSVSQFPHQLRRRIVL